MEQSKTCRRCKQTKLLDEFNKDKSQPDGRQYKCRDCERIIRRDYYLKNKKREVARVSNWHKTTEKGQANREKEALRLKQSRPRRYIPVEYLSLSSAEKRRIRWAKKGLKRRALKRNAETHDITNKEIARLLSQPCIYCQSKINTTIDHVIPLDRGGRHSLGNLAPACHSCNSKKQARFIMEWRLNKSRADRLRTTCP